jgi:hypothetical protein
MRGDLTRRLGQATAACAVGLAAVAAASTADAQNWNGYNGGYYPPLTNAPYNGPYSNRGWTWGERYGAPPNAYYSNQGYNQGYYAPQNSYSYNSNPSYGANPQAALGNIMGLFAR